MKSEFYTNKVHNMEGMFDCVGHNSAIFTLNLGNNFDTSQVTTMSHMFQAVGYNNPNFTLDLGNNLIPIK